MAISLEAVKEVCNVVFDLYETYEDYSAQMDDLTIVLLSLEKIVADRGKIDSFSAPSSTASSPGAQLMHVFKQVKATVDYFRIHKSVASKLMFGAQVKNKMEDLDRLTRRLERILKMIDLETQTASAHSLALLAGQQATNFIKLRHMKQFWSVNFGSKTRIPWQDFRVAVLDQYGAVLQEHLGHSTWKVLQGLRACLDHDGDGIVDVREFASLVNPKTESELREQEGMSFITLLLSMLSGFDGAATQQLSILVMGGHTAEITLLEHIPPFVISADRHGMVSIWNAEMIDNGLDHITTLRTYSERLTSTCMFDRNALTGVQLCFGGSDGDLCIVDVYSSKIVGVVDNYGVDINDLCSAERKLFVCGKHSFITVYSVDARSKIQQLHGHKSEVTALCVFGEEEGTFVSGNHVRPNYVLISGSSDGELRGWSRDLTLAWVVACPTPLAVTKLFSNSTQIAVLQEDERRPARVLLLRQHGDDDATTVVDQSPILQAVLMEDEDECEIQNISLSEKFLAYTVTTTARARNRNNIRCLETDKMHGNMLANYSTWKNKYESHASRQPRQLLIVKGHLLWGNEKGTLHNAPVVKAASCPKGHMLQVRHTGVPKLVPCARCAQNCCLVGGQQSSSKQVAAGTWYACPLCKYDLCSECVGVSKPVPQLLLAPEFDDLSPQNSPRAGATLLSGGSKRHEQQFSATNARLTVRSGCGIWTPHCGTQTKSGNFEEMLNRPTSSSSSSNVASIFDTANEKTMSSSSSCCVALFTRDRILSCGGGIVARVFDTHGQFLWSHTLLDAPSTGGGLWVFRDQSRRSKLAINTAAHLQKHRQPGSFTPSITSVCALHRASERAIPFLFVGTDQGQLGVFAMNQNAPWELRSQHQLVDIEVECCTDCGTRLLTAHERFSRCCFSCVRVKTRRVRPKIHLPRASVWKPPSIVKNTADTTAHKLSLAINKWKKKQMWVQHGPNGLELVYNEEGASLPDGNAKIIPLDEATVEKIPSDDMKTSGCDMTVIGNGLKISTPDREYVFATVDEDDCNLYVETLHADAIVSQYECYHCKNEYVSRGKILCHTCLAEQRQKLQVKVVSMTVNRNRSLFVGCESASCPGGYVVELPLKFDKASGAFVTLLPPIEGGALWRWRAGVHTFCSFGISDEYFACCDGKFSPFVKVFLVDPELGSTHTKRPSSISPTGASPLRHSMPAAGNDSTSPKLNPHRTNPYPTPTRARHLCSLDEITAPVTALHAPSLHSTALEHRTAAERNILYAASQDCKIHLYVIERSYHPEKPDEHALQTQLRGVFLWLQSTECNTATAICATARTVSAGFEGGGVLVWSGVKTSVNDTDVNYTVGPMLKLLGHQASVSSIGLSPNGELFTQGGDNAVHFWDFVPLLRQAFHTKRRLRKAKQKKQNEDDIGLASVASLNTCMSFGEVDDMEEGASTFFDPKGNLISGLDDSTQQGIAAKNNSIKEAENEEDGSSDDDSHIDHDQWLWNWCYVVDEANRSFVTENEFDLCRVESYTPTASDEKQRTGKILTPQPFCTNTCRQLNDLWSDVRDFGAHCGEIEDPNFGLMIVVITETGEWFASSSENVKAKMRIVADVEIAKVCDTIFLHTLSATDGLWNNDEDVRHGSEIELRRNVGAAQETAVEMLLQLNTAAVASYQSFSQLQLTLKFHILTFQSNEDSMDVTFYFAKKIASSQSSGENEDDADTERSQPAQQEDQQVHNIDAFIKTAPFKRTVIVDRYDTEILVPFDDFQNSLFTDFRKKYVCVARVEPSKKTGSSGSSSAMLRCVLSQRDRNPVVAAKVVPSCWGPETIPPVVQAQQHGRRLPPRANPTFEERQFQLYPCRACGHNPDARAGHKWTCSHCGHGKINQPHRSIRCPICRRRFGVFNRRNCYSCGEMVCLSCSNNTASDPKNPTGSSMGYSEKEEVYVCAVCSSNDPDAPVFAPSNIDKL